MPKHIKPKQEPLSAKSVMKFAKTISKHLPKKGERLLPKQHMLVVGKGFSTKSSYKGKKKTLLSEATPEQRRELVGYVDFSYLREEYGKGLKPEKQREIENMIRRFAELAYAKYAAGAKEHKDDLTVEVAKKELGKEGLDMIIYLFKAGLL